MNKGAWYEQKARELLGYKHYAIIASNFRTRFGEIDIIARQGKEIVFVEVKARSAGCGYAPEEAVTGDKRDKLLAAAKVYSSQKPDAAYRFDVISIVQGRQWRIYRLIQNAFSADEKL